MNTRVIGPRYFAFAFLIAATGCSQIGDSSSTAQTGFELSDSGQFQSGFTTRSGDILFADDFDDLGPPYRPEDEQNGPFVPRDLFPEDGSRWTQIQNTHPGTNVLAYQQDVGVVRFFASGQDDGVASKMDLSRELGFEFGPGDVAYIGADLYVADSGTNFANNTLIDLEDTDDLIIDGELQGAGLRLRTNDDGKLVLDRGEILGVDGDEDPHFRLGSMKSNFTLPTNAWVRIELIIRLGIGVRQSTTQPIDMSFDGSSTAAWCEIWVTNPGEGQPTLVMRQMGTTFLDRALGLALIKTQAPDMQVEWPDMVDYNSIQIGLTNNRSGSDQQMAIDRVQVARLEET